MLKLDISKAFDSVHWPFLLEVLRKAGFGERWITWICGLLASSSTRIMINGMPGRPIYNTMGLRQGAPLSPMLFILIMEPLHCMFELATTRGLLAPLARTGLHHRLSMFADDVMIFLKTNERDLSTCASLLTLFGEASGLRVNLAKSAVYPIRCSAETLEIVERALGCPRGTFLCKYLGLPLTLRKQSHVQLSGLVDQLAMALPKWKATKMPKSGRMLLVQTVLCAMPLHAMMALDLPQKTISAMNKICRSFLW
uniref:Reverse transcriptase domain-containing protein n=1 Tax=Triticum urartu TaxID=4572 RepID=A0A8R7TQP3_TRIUA